MPAEHSIATLLARVHELEAALRPFAAMAEVYRNRPGEVRLLSCATGEVTVRDFARARTAMNKADSGETLQ